MVNRYKLKLTILQQEILRFLFIKAGRSFNARTVAKALEVSPPAISKALPGLEKENFIIVTKDKESKRLAIELNRDQPAIIELKRVDNLRQLYESGLINFLQHSCPGTTIILFGSYAHGEDTVTSDIDVAVMGIKAKQRDVAAYEKILEREIIINYYSSFQKIAKHLLNNILNGITLKGAVEL